MKLTLVNVEDGIVSVGFRKMAAHVRGYHPGATIRYVRPNRRSLREHLSPSDPRDVGYALYRLGAIDLWQGRFIPRPRAARVANEASPETP